MNGIVSILFISTVAVLQQSPTPTPVSIEVVDKVRQFYTDAWNMLLYYVTALIAIVGVAVPLVTQWYQHRAFRHEEAKLIKELSRENETLVKELIEKRAGELSDRLNKKLENDVGILKRETARAEAGAYMVQSSFLWSQGRHVQALESGLAAIKSAVQSKDQANVQRALINVTRDILPHIRQEELDERPHISQEVASVFQLLEAENEDRRYTNYMLNLQKAFKELNSKKG